MISYPELVLVRNATPSRRVESKGLEKGIKILVIYSILSKTVSTPTKFFFAFKMKRVTWSEVARRSKILLSASIRIYWARIV